VEYPDLSYKYQYFENSDKRSEPYYRSVDDEQEIQIDYTRYIITGLIENVPEYRVEC
jgi:hypothetical protein